MNPRIIRPGEPEYQSCSYCIMDTTDPLITFDEDGRCNHCLRVDEWKRNVWNPEGDPKQLERLLDSIREDGKGRDYDVVLGLSGGVDSSYLAYLCKLWGLRTLIIHVDTGWNSELAVQNIENLIRFGGFDLDTLVVDWDEMQDLQLAFFKAGVPNQDIPQDHAISSGFLRQASKHDVKWTFIGTNFACEGILPISWGYDNQDTIHIKDIHKRFGSLPLKKFPLISWSTRFVKYKLLFRLKKAAPLNLIHYNKAQSIKTLEQETNWRYYGGKHYESRFTKFFQGWYLPQKWGYDKRLAHLSSLIASGQVSRENALAEFDQHPLPSEVEDEMSYMANKLGIDIEAFRELMTNPNRPHSHYRSVSPSWAYFCRYLNAVASRLGF